MLKTRAASSLDSWPHPLVKSTPPIPGSVRRIGRDRQQQRGERHGDGEHETGWKTACVHEDLRCRWRAHRTWVRFGQYNPDESAVKCAVWSGSASRFGKDRRRCPRVNRRVGAHRMRPNTTVRAPTPPLPPPVTLPRGSRYPTTELVRRGSSRGGW